ncbi:MAG: hypothetical protein WBD04_02485, partial [Candidatus Omnitrophota bacterium]
TAEGSDDPEVAEEAEVVEAGALDLSELRYEIKRYTSNIAEYSMEISRLIRARDMADEIKQRYDKAEEEMKKKEAELEAAKVALLTFIEKHFEPLEYYRVRGAIRETLDETADLDDVFAGLEAGERVVAAVDIEDERVINVNNMEQAEKLREVGKVRFYQSAPGEWIKINRELQEEKLLHYFRTSASTPGEVLRIMVTDKTRPDRRRHILELNEKGIPVYCTVEQRTEKLNILQENGILEAFQNLKDGEKLFAEFGDEKIEVISEEHAKELFKRYDARFYLTRPAGRVKLSIDTMAEFWKMYNEGAAALTVYAEISDAARETWTSSYERIDAETPEMKLLSEIQRTSSVEEMNLDIYRVAKEEEKRLGSLPDVRAALKSIEEGERVTARVKRVEIDVRPVEHAKKLAEDGVKLYRVREQEEVKLDSPAEAKKIFEQSEEAPEQATVVIAEIGDEVIEVESIKQARKLLERAGVKFYLETEVKEFKEIEKALKNARGTEVISNIRDKKDKEIKVKSAEHYRQLSEREGAEFRLKTAIKEFKEVERALKTIKLREDEKVFISLHGKRTQVESVEGIQAALGRLTGEAKFYHKEYRDVRLKSMDEVLKALANLQEGEEVFIREDGQKAEVVSPKKAQKLLRQLRFNRAEFYRVKGEDRTARLNSKDEVEAALGSLEEGEKIFVSYTTPANTPPALLTFLRGLGKLQKGKEEYIVGEDGIRKKVIVASGKIIEKLLQEPLWFGHLEFHRVKTAKRARLRNLHKVEEAIRARKEGEKITFVRNGME